MQSGKNKAKAEKKKKAKKRKQTNFNNTHKKGPDRDSKSEEEAKSIKTMVNIFITQLEPNDVLLGRGTGPNANEGNRRFRILSSQLISISKTRSTSDDQQEQGEHQVQESDLAVSNKKRLLAEKLVKLVQSRKGRFVRKLTKEESCQVAQEMYRTTDKKVLKKNKLPDLFVVVPDQVAIEKAKQSFRHQLRRTRSSSSEEEEDDDVHVDDHPSSSEDLLMATNEEVEEETKAEAAKTAIPTSSSSNIDSPDTAPVTFTVTTPTSASISSEAEAKAALCRLVPEDAAGKGLVVTSNVAVSSPVLMGRIHHRHQQQQHSSVAHVAGGPSVASAAAAVLQAELASSSPAAAHHLPRTTIYNGNQYQHQYQYEHQHQYGATSTTTTTTSAALQELSFLIQLENKLRSKRLQMAQGGSLPLFPSLSSLSSSSTSIWTPASSSSSSASATRRHIHPLLEDLLVGGTGRGTSITATASTPTSRIVTPTNTTGKKTMTTKKVKGNGGGGAVVPFAPFAPVALSPLQPPPSLLIKHQNMNPIDSNLIYSSSSGGNGNGEQQRPAPLPKCTTTTKNPFLSRKSRPMDPSMFIFNKHVAGGNAEEMSAVDTLSTLYLN